MPRLRPSNTPLPEMVGKSSESAAFLIMIGKLQPRTCWQDSGEPPIGGVVNRPLVPLSVEGGVIRDISESTSCYRFK